MGLLCKVNARQDNNMYIGLFSGSNYLFNATDKSYIKSDLNCGEFDSGTAQGIHAGIKLGYIVSKDFISLEGRLFYDTRPFNMVGGSDCFEVLDPVSNKYVPFKRSHYFDGTLDYLSFDLGLSVQPISSLPISLRLSFDIGNPIVKNDFTVKEAVKSPKSVSFSNGSQSRINESGEFNDVTSSMGLNAGIGYTHMFNKDLGANLELSYRYAVNSALSDNLLKSDILRLSLVLSYYFGREKPEPVKVIPVVEPEPEPEEPVVTEYVSKPSIVTDMSIEPLDVTETIVTQTFPLLSYYFFDEKSSKLNDKYINTMPAEDFDEGKLNKETMTIYYNSLDIIGKRLSTNNSNIRIVGYSDGNELPTLQERRELAQARAKTVADYFHTKWHIPYNRLKVESGDKPGIYTNPEEAAFENRRVEILSDDGKNLAPVVHRQFSEYKFNTDKLNFNMQVSRPTRLNYSLTINQRPYYSNEVQLKEGKFEANLNLNKNQIDSLISISKNKRLTLKLDLYDGELFEMHSIPFEFNIETEQFEIGRLNLIVFDFDKANLSKFNNDLLKDFAKEAIRANSEVYIYGTTDILGTLDYNLSLSQKRADNTASAIRSVLPDANFKHIQGKGSENPKYDNSLPEGRFYNRTVLIEVRTPLE